jgi:hypothetical protein
VFVPPTSTPIRKVACAMEEGEIDPNRVVKIRACDFGTILGPQNSYRRPAVVARSYHKPYCFGTVRMLRRLIGFLAALDA